MIFKIRISRKLCLKKKDMLINFIEIKKKVVLFYNFLHRHFTDIKGKQISKELKYDNFSFNMF